MLNSVLQETGPRSSKKQIKWVLDNGCSRHMTGRKELFEWIAPVERGPIVVFGDNSKGRVIATGRI